MPEDNPLTDKEFDLLGKIDDRIDELYADTSMTRKKKRIHLRRLNRVLVAFGESAYPDFRRARPADLDTVQRWASIDTQGAGAFYQEITLVMIERQNRKEKVRPTLVDDKATIRGMQVPTDLGFFIKYCDKNADAILEATIARWASEVAIMESLSEEDFDALCRGRKQSAEECLVSFFGELPKWMSDPDSVKDALEDAKDNLEEWAEWERQDAERLEEAKRLRAERQAALDAAQ